MKMKIKTEQHKLYRIDRISKRSLDEWNSTVTISGVTSAINDNAKRGANLRKSRTNSVFKKGGVTKLLGNVCCHSTKVTRS